MARQNKKRQSSSRRRKKGSSNFTQALLRLKKMNASDQHRAMKMANNAFIRQFCKHLKQLKHAKLSVKNRKALRKHKKKLRQLINARTSMSKRRQVLSQKGGSLLKTLFKFIPGVGPFADLLF